MDPNEHFVDVDPPFHNINTILEVVDFARNRFQLRTLRISAGIPFASFNRRGILANPNTELPE